MTVVAALYDVHGNLPALDAVLADAAFARADAVVVGGDVAAGPLPAEVLDRLTGLDLPVRWVRGNADREVVAHFDRGDTDPSVYGPDAPAQRADAFTAARISRAHRDLMAGFEDVVRLDGALYCHGSPRSDDEIITAVTPGDRLVPMVAAVPEALIVCGHTHHQFELRAGDDEAGVALMAAAANGPAPATLVIPDANATAMANLRRWGFRAANAGERMRLGPPVAWRPERQFGLFNLFWG